MTAADDVERWRPDQHTIPAVLAGGAAYTLEQFEYPDRCWLVAGLYGIHRLTADDIADRLDCSTRTVRALWADPMTQMCVLYQSEARTFRQAVELEQSEHATTLRALDAVTVERDRLRDQIGQIIDAGVIGEQVTFCRNGHLMDRYNSYIHAETGSVRCRACRRDNAQKYRDRRKVVIREPITDSSAIAPTGPLPLASDRPVGGSVTDPGGLRLGHAFTPEGVVDVGPLE